MMHLHLVDESRTTGSVSATCCVSSLASNSWCGSGDYMENYTIRSWHNSLVWDDPISLDFDLQPSGHMSGDFRGCFDTLSFSG